MSHEATHWLSNLAADQLSASEFRVLFHLCDCHNPANGCFPTQAYLKDRANVSNGTLNNALRALEEKGIIRRQKRYDNVQKRSLPTRYLLGYEFDENQTPKNGARTRPDSNLDHEQTPIETTTRLQPTGDITSKETGKEPVRERSHASAADCFPKDWVPGEDDQRWARSLGFEDYDIREQTRRLVNDPKHARRARRFPSLSEAWRDWMQLELKHRVKRFDAIAGREQRDPLLDYDRNREADVDV